MFYPEELVEEVRSKNDIVDVISGYVRMQKKGVNHWGCCPFHNEKTPSFAVNGAKQMYHCFGCGVGGNVFTFVMNYENYSFPEAIKVLADRVGVKLPEIEFTQEQKEKQNKRSRLLEVNKEAAKYFYYMLRQPQGQNGLAYLQKRELTEETMKKFGLGFADNGAGLIRYLRQKGYEDSLIIEAGLGSFSERTGLLGAFWNRVMYPIFDVHGKVIGFGGRVMGDGEPKYLNSQETPVFDKRRNLYGLNFARTSRSGYMILCEGYMDVISMHQAGFGQAVASLGTAFTPEQAALLHRYTDNILLAYDSDGAGVKAALRAIGLLRDAGMSGKVIDMRPYKDPDEFMKNLGREEFQKRIDQAENSFFFECRILEGNYNLKDPEEKTKFHKEIAKKLCEFSEEVERDNYLEAAADKYNIGFEQLRKLVNTYAAKTGLAAPVTRPKSGVQKTQNPDENKKRSQRLLLSWIADDPSVYKKISPYIKADDFTDELYQKAAGRLFEDLQQDRFNPASIISMFEDGEEQKEIAALFQDSLPPIESLQDRERALHDILYTVKKNSYEYYTSRLGSDVTALNQVIEGKKALEQLSKLHISLE